MDLFYLNQNFEFEFSIGHATTLQLVGRIYFSFGHT